METNILGNRIKTLRLEANLTQEEFGKPYSLKKSTVSQYESGSSRPDDELKKRIALDYNVSLDWLMGLSDIKNYTENQNGNNVINMITLADRLKEIRKNNNLTQAELGKILGVGKTTVSMYETNNSSPSDEIKLKISEYFNVSLDFLLGNSNIILINQPELSLHQKVALKFADKLTEDGYQLEDNDLNDLLLFSKFTLDQKKNKK